MGKLNTQHPQTPTYRLLQNCCCMLHPKRIKDCPILMCQSSAKVLHSVLKPIQEPDKRKALYQHQPAQFPWFEHHSAEALHPVGIFASCLTTCVSTITRCVSLLLGTKKVHAHIRSCLIPFFSAATPTHIWRCV